MAPHRARQLRVEVLRACAENACRWLAAAHEARELLPERERAVIYSARELGRALLALDAYEAGKMPRARKVRP